MSQNQECSLKPDIISNLFLLVFAKENMTEYGKINWFSIYVLVVCMGTVTQGWDINDLKITF